MFVTETESATVKKYFSSSKTDDLLEIKKAIERQIITNVLAPRLLVQKLAIKGKYDLQFADVAKNVRQNVRIAAEQLDDSMKGQFSKKAAAVIKENSEKYKEI